MNQSEHEENTFTWSIAKKKRVQTKPSILKNMNNLRRRIFDLILKAVSLLSQETRFCHQCVKIACVTILPQPSRLS